MENLWGFLGLISCDSCWLRPNAAGLGHSKWWWLRIREFPLKKIDVGSSLGVHMLLFYRWSYTVWYWNCVRTYFVKLNGVYPGGLQCYFKRVLSDSWVEVRYFHTGKYKFALQLQQRWRTDLARIRHEAVQGPRFQRCWESLPSHIGQV